MVKSRLYGEDQESKETAEKVLLLVLKNILKLLHPFMPFITEEIWQHLPIDEAPLIVNTWPKYREDLSFVDAERHIEYIKTAISKIRNIRNEMDIIPSRKSEQIFATDDEEIRSIIKNGERYFINLASADSVRLVENISEIGEETVSVVLDRAEVLLPLSELIDYEKELERLEKEKAKLEGEIKRAKGKLSNKGFTDKAPEHLVNQEKEKLAKYEGMYESTLDRIAGVKKNL